MLDHPKKTISVSCFHPEHKFFTHMSVAKLSPRQPEDAKEPYYLMPANSTRIQAPDCNEGDVAIFNGSTWDIVPDNRGDAYHKDTKDLLRIEDPQGSCPATHTLSVPHDIDCIWDNTNQKWILPQAVAIVRLTAKVKERCETIIQDGMNYQGHVYQIDEKSVSKFQTIMLAFVMGQANPHQGDWRTKDNQQVPMTDTQVKALILAAQSYVAQLLHAKWSHEDAIENADDLDAYDITINWPLNTL